MPLGQTAERTPGSVEPAVDFGGSFRRPFRSAGDRTTPPASSDRIVQPAVMNRPVHPEAESWERAVLEAAAEAVANVVNRPRASQLPPGLVVGPRKPTRSYASVAVRAGQVPGSGVALRVP